MKFLLHSAALCVGLMIAPACVLAAPAADGASETKEEKTEAVPLPADASARQSMRLAGRTLDYTATVGTLPVRDEKGKVIADVVFTAYTMPGKDRPVTFALNGSLARLPGLARDALATAQALDEACPALAALAAPSAGQADLLQRCHDRLAEMVSELRGRGYCPSGMDLVNAINAFRRDPSAGVPVVGKAVLADAAPVAVPEPTPLPEAELAEVPAEALSVPTAAEAEPVAAPEAADDFAALEGEVAAMLAPVKGKPLVTYHDAFGYFAEAYGITFMAPEGISTDSGLRPTALVLSSRGRNSP